MKKTLHFVIGLAILVIFSCAFSNNKKGCEQFKKGHFKFHPKGQSEDYYFLIERNDSTQIETDTKSNHFSKYSIKWTDKCTYELMLLETSYPHTDTVLKMIKAMPLKTEILSWTDGYYIFKVKRDNMNFSLTDTIWVEK